MSVCNTQIVSPDYDDIPTIEQATGHVLSMAGITLYHLVARLKACIRDFSHTECLMVGLLSRDDGCICDQREVDAGVGYKVGLEFGQIYVECTVETERGGD